MLLRLQGVVLLVLVTEQMPNAHAVVAQAGRKELLKPNCIHWEDMK
jgi:hypothetical protein